jgi:hypothetical protein
VKTRTRGGRHSSACRRSTEKPPCVLVSEAVSVLQKDLTAGRGGVVLDPAFSAAAASFCCVKKPGTSKQAHLLVPPAKKKSTPKEEKLLRARRLLPALA